MRVCVFGSGAIGGYLAAKLAATGRVDLSLVARGPHLDAIRARGITLIEGGRQSVHAVNAGAAAALGPQDYVVLTLKVHSIPPALNQIAPLLGPDSTAPEERTRARASRPSTPAGESGTASAPSGCWERSPTRLSR